MRPFFLYPQRIFYPDIVFKRHLPDFLQAPLVGHPLQGVKSFAVLAASLKSLSEGAPDAPFLRIRSPDPALIRFLLLWMFSYNDIATPRRAYMPHTTTLGYAAQIPSDRFTPILLGLLSNS